MTGFCLNRWMQYDLPDVADPLLLTQSEDDCTGRGMRGKKSVGLRSRK